MAADLSERGYKIIAQNFKKPGFEIDILAAKANTLYIVEVKFRNSSNFGSGFDYIGKTKLKHLELAAKSLLNSPDFKKYKFIEILFAEVDNRQYIKYLRY